MEASTPERIREKKTLEEIRDEGAGGREGGTAKSFSVG